MRVAIAIPPPATVTSGPLLGASLDDDRLLEQLLRRDAGDLAIGERSDERTDRGWRYTMLRGVVGTEQRIAVMYRFGEWRGYVLVRIEDAELAPAVIHALGSATPDWRGDGETHTIAELFE
jgi:hypothetical protein